MVRVYVIWRAKRPRQTISSTDYGKSLAFKMSADDGEI